MHLSLLEHGVYNQMLDWYYLDEKPLPSDNRTLFRRLSANTEDEQKAVIDVLQEMFDQTDLGWVHKRVEREIMQYKAKAEQARNAGRLGGRPLKKGIGSENNRDGFEKKPDAKLTANREPLTANRKPLIEPNGSFGKPTVPPAPFQKLIAVYHEILPELDGVRVINPAREKSCASFWRWVLTSTRGDGSRRAETTEQGVEFTREYFTRARNSDWIMGRDPDSKGWKGDFDYLMSKKGLIRVVEKTK